MIGPAVDRRKREEMNEGKNGKEENTLTRATCACWQIIIFLPEIRWWRCSHEFDDSHPFGTATERLLTIYNNNNINSLAERRCVTFDFVPLSSVCTMREGMLALRHIYSIDSNK